MSDSSSVDINALGDVGITLMTTLLSGHEKPFGEAGEKIGAAEVGAAGTSEAHQFAAWYTGATDALGQFLADVTHGVRALGNTAVVMADNYRHGDLSQGEAMKDVQRALHPSKSDPTLASQDAANARDHKETSSSGDPYHLKSNGHPKPPKPDPQSPQVQVQQHEHKYGKQEHWHPVDPSPPIDPNNMPA